jgi:hypothetical protein
VYRLAGIFLEVHARDPDALRAEVARDLDVTLGAERMVVLGDLIVLRHVGIEVVLTMEQAPPCDLAVESETDLHRVLDGLLVGNRERPGQPEAHGAGARVRLTGEGDLAATEHLRLGGQLDVDLQPHRCLVNVGDAHRGGLLSIEPAHPRSFSKA